MAEKAYRYIGPDACHAGIGQIMAYLGYVGGHEEQLVCATISMTEFPDHYLLTCDFFDTPEKVWHQEQTIKPKQQWREKVKNLLLQWHETYCGEGPSKWGSLMGVRPTKLVHHLFDQGQQDEQVCRQLEQRFRVHPDVARELVDMARLQRPYVTSVGRTAALYIGVPYCSSHCLYCSFPSRLIGQESSIGLESFLAALLLDMEGIYQVCEECGLTIDSAYIGGGTPTCLPVTVLEPMLKAVAQYFPAIDEWTVEAGRPDTATEEKLSLLRQYGVDRISVNPQTMQQRVLDMMGRRHQVDDIYRMYENCRKLAFHTINMDFIAGLPGQTVSDMQENMEIVCQLVPENVTIHTLALKKRAPLFDHPLRAKIAPAEVVAEMLGQSRRILHDNNYIPYYMYRQKYMAGSFANVGYALPGHIGKYNIQMMEERQTVFAAGPGGANKFVAAPMQPLEKLYMPKDITAYVHTVRDKISLRRQLCRNIYGGDD